MAILSFQKLFELIFELSWDYKLPDFETVCMYSFAGGLKVLVLSSIEGI